MSGRAVGGSSAERWTGASAGKDKEGVTVDASDRELQQYLFDLQGYVVLHDVLEAAEVAELDRLIDAQRLPSPRESIPCGSGTGFGWTVSMGSACSRGKPWGPCMRTTELRRSTPSSGQASAFTLPPTASTRGSRSRPGILPTPDQPAEDSGAFPGVTRATSRCRARSTKLQKRPPA